MTETPDGPARAARGDAAPDAAADDPGTPEAPEADPGTPEAPEADAGTPEADAGTPEADAGTPEADAGTPDAPGSSAAPERQRSLAARATYRRAPRFGRFAGTGVLIGAGLAALAAVLGPPGDILGREAIFLLLFLAFGTAGALVGTAFAVRADRRSLPKPPRDGASG